MASKKKHAKRFDVRKKRAKLLKEREKQQPKEEREEKKKFKTEKEEKLEIRLAKETKLYWIRAATGAMSAIIGSLIGLKSWWLLILMLSFWLGFPFLASFLILRYKYDKEEWNWKNIIRPGIGIFFFLFMIIVVILHTLQVIA